jgi:curved DNA-binding protein
LGASVSVPTLTAPVSIKIPPATQTGQRLRVRGHGLPGRGNNAQGDLYVVAHIQMPKEIRDHAKGLWEQLARESHFNPRE